MAGSLSTYDGKIIGDARDFAELKRNSTAKNVNDFSEKGSFGLWRDSTRFFSSPDKEEVMKGMDSIREVYNDALTCLDMVERGDERSYDKLVEVELKLDKKEKEAERGKANSTSCTFIRECREFLSNKVKLNHEMKRVECVVLQRKVKAIAEDLQKSRQNVNNMKKQLDDSEVKAEREIKGLRNENQELKETKERQKLEFKKRLEEEKKELKEMKDRERQELKEMKDKERQELKEMKDRERQELKEMKDKERQELIEMKDNERQELKEKVEIEKQELQELREKVEKEKQVLREMKDKELQELREKVEKEKQVLREMKDKELQDLREKVEKEKQELREMKDKELQDLKEKVEKEKQELREMKDKELQDLKEMFEDMYRRNNGTMLELIRTMTVSTQQQFSNNSINND